MARTYNQQNSDGSWTQVTANDDGTYTSVPIAPSGYGAANIPTGDSSASTAGGYSYDPGAASAATAATNAATSAAAEKAAEVFQRWEMATGDQKFAFEKATEAWNETFKQSQANIANVLDYLGLQSKLSGPANAFNYAKLLTGTPGGLADIVRAAGGAYQLPQFGGGSGGSSTPLTLQSMINDVAAYSPTAGGQQAQAPPPTSSGPPQYNTVNGPKTVAQMGAELKTAGWGGNVNDPVAVQAAYGSTTKGAVTPMAANVDTSGTHTQLPAPATSNTAGQGYIPAFGNPPTTGNQFAPGFINKADPGQKALLSSYYGSTGWNWDDLMSQYQKSLGAYGGPTRGGSGF